MCCHHRRPVKGSCIVKPTKGSERYVRVDVDLRNGAGLVGAQLHLEKPMKHVKIH